jgi:hypothetical protein
MAHTQEQKELIMKVFGLTDEANLNRKFPPYDAIQKLKGKMSQEEMMAIWKGISVEEWESEVQFLRDMAAAEDQDEKESS